MGVLLLSEDNVVVSDWNLDEIIIESKKKSLERLLQYNEDNTIGPYCNGLTYLEIEQLDRRFNN
jgi:hypothetical protein